MKKNARKAAHSLPGRYAFLHNAQATSQGKAIEPTPFETGYRVKVMLDNVEVRQCESSTTVSAWPYYLVTLPRVCYLDQWFAPIVSQLNLSPRDLAAVWETWRRMAKMRGWHLSAPRRRAPLGIYVEDPVAQRFLDICGRIMTAKQRKTAVGRFEGSLRREGCVMD